VHAHVHVYVYVRGVSGTHRVRRWRRMRGVKWGGGGDGVIMSGTTALAHGM
jgi:hypothetical protein